MNNHLKIVYYALAACTLTPVVAWADSNVGTFSSVVTTGPVKQGTSGSNNRQKINVGSANNSSATSFSAVVNTGSITQTSQGAGIQQSINAGSLSNSSAASFSATVNTGNIVQSSTRSGSSQELDVGSVSNSTVRGAATTNVKTGDINQTGAGEIALGSVKGSSVSGFNSNLSVGNISGNNVRMGSIVGQKKYDNDGNYQGEEPIADNSNGGMGLPVIIGGSGKGIARTGPGTTNQKNGGVPITQPNSPEVKFFYSDAKLNKTPIKNGQQSNPNTTNLLSLSRLDLGFIRKFYRVDDYAKYDWLNRYMFSATVTDAELGFILQLPLSKWPLFYNLKSEAFEAADTAFPQPSDWAGEPIDWKNLGHNDAFRHAYWNARLTQEFGEEWTRYFTTAHESIAGNEPSRENQDLYNNEMGRKIGVASPDASSDEIYNQINKLVQGGSLIVVDRNGEINWSDLVHLGEHYVENIK